jgi:hypothetical protein
MDLASIGCQKNYSCRGQTKDLLSSSYFNTSSFSEFYCSFPHPSQTNAGIGHYHSFLNPLQLLNIITISFIRPYTALQFKFTVANLVKLQLLKLCNLES